MAPPDPTLDATRASDLAGSGAPRPGVVVVFSGRRPACVALDATRSAVLLGREGPLAELVNDPKLSRRHATVSWSDGGWFVEDLASRNGTFVDATPLVGRAPAAPDVVLRFGDTVAILVDDVRPYVGHAPADDGAPIAGPTLLAAWQSIARVARVSETLHITGESGAGKELAARTFHDAGAHARGPFVAVNCAAIPEGVAERLLFGARKGAFSGAVADAEGYVRAAHEGTLFLDEVGELDLNVQAKLLRVLESREVMPLGATRPEAVSLRLVSATHRDLRARVAEGRMREDLYFRIGRPVVTLPPLRARRDEIAWHAARVVRKAAPELGLHASLVEAALLRPWPGNVRELQAEVQSAVQECLAASRAVVEARHLSDTAGRAFAAAPRASAPPAAPEPAPPRTPMRPVSREEVTAALAAAGGNITHAARALGLHRTQLRRLFERYGIDPHAPDAGDEE